MQVKVEREELSRVEVKLKVEAPAEEVKAAYDSVYRELQKSVELPGFRRGKTPLDLVRKHSKQDKVDEEVQEAVIPPAYEAAIDQEKLEPVETPRIVVKSQKEGEPLVFEATIPLAPEIALGDYVGLEVETIRYEATDESVERDLANLREQWAEYKDAGDREIRPGDRVIAEMTTSAGESEQPSAPQKYVIEVGESADDFDQQLLGATKDEERLITVSYPEDHPDQAVQGKTMRYFVKVLDIKEKVLPELTDELVKERTRFETLEALRNEVRANQDRQFKRLAEDLAVDRLIAKVVENSTVEYPTAMLTREVMKDYARLDQALKEREKTLEAFLRERPAEAKEFDEEARKAGERRLRTGLVLGQIADTEGMKVTEDDVTQEIRRIADEHDTQPAVVREMLEKEEAIPRLENELLRRRISEFLMASATVKVRTIPAGQPPTEVEEATEDQPAEGGEPGAAGGSS